MHQFGAAPVRLLLFTMDREAALTLLILAKREASVSTGKLQELCHWGKERGCFKTPETMFSATEFCELGDKLWTRRLRGLVPQKLSDRLGEK